MYVWMYVYMHVCMHACMYVCVYVCMYVCMYVCVCMCVCVCMYVCIKKTHNYFTIREVGVVVVFDDTYFYAYTNLSLKHAFLGTHTSA